MPKIQMMSIMAIAVLFGAGPALAKDDGGFGSARFTAQAPAALGGAPVMDAMANIQMEVSPADIEPAAGEEDIRPDVEQLDGSVQLNSEHPDDTHVIQNDMIVR